MTIHLLCVAEETSQKRLAVTHEEAKEMQESDHPGDDGYDGDLSDKDWSTIDPLIPVNKGAGANMELDLRDVVNAALYRQRTKCSWRHLPQRYPKWSSVYYHYNKWVRNGTMERINANLEALSRYAQPQRLSHQ